VGPVPRAQALGATPQRNDPGRAPARSLPLAGQPAKRAPQESRIPAPKPPIDQYHASARIPERLRRRCLHPSPPRSPFDPAVLPCCSPSTLSRRLRRDSHRPQTTRICLAWSRDLRVSQPPGRSMMHRTGHPRQPLLRMNPTGPPPGGPLPRFPLFGAPSSLLACDLPALPLRSQFDGDLLNV